MLTTPRHHDEPHKNSSSGMQSASGAMSMSCSPAPDSSQDGVHDIDDEKLDVVGTSDGRDGASPLHISDGKNNITNHMIHSNFDSVTLLYLFVCLSYISTHYSQAFAKKNA